MQRAFPKVSLKHEEHNKKTERIFKNLLSDTEFSDVTLVSADGSHHKGHKAILAHCSYYLHKLFAKDSLQSTYHLPVQSSILVSLFEYIYLGQTKVEVAQINNFMKISDVLLIDGLSKSDMNILPKETARDQL